jgi:predicted nucleotidyltransferase
MGNEVERAERFAEQLAELYGGELLSVVLYGSAARDEFHAGASDLNVLVLLRAVDEPALRACAGLAAGWVEEGNAPPLILAEAELHRSLDIFPIEYSEIRDAHRVLHGSDPFERLEIDAEHLRLQCERELKIALIQLRERYLLAAGDASRVGELFRMSIASLVVHMRTILRLEGAEVPRDSEAAVQRVAERAGFSPEPLLRVLRARRAGEALVVEPGDPLAVGYLAAADALVGYVDGLQAVQR